MKRFFAFLSLVAISATAFSANVHADTKTSNAPTSIRQTPPAPKFSDAERQTELASRRAKVFAEMKDNSVMVLMSTAPRVYTNDVDFLYRQENNLYYLTNLKQPNTTLVLVKSGGATQEFLFLPKRNPQFETWNGRMYSNDDAARISGVKTILDAAQWKDFLANLQNKQPFSANGFSFTPAAQNLYLLTPTDAGDTREYQREFDLAKTMANAKIDEKTKDVTYEKNGAYQVVSAFPIFDKLRHIKSPYEIKVMQHAIDISTEAHMRAMATVKQVKWEYETQAEIEYIFKRRNADYWGYPSIVGCGPNATTLHYVESQGEVKPGNLFLIDVGAEYDHITADVTRTFPVNGKFTKEQAEIYQIVYDAQEAVGRATKPGVQFGQLGKAADEVIKQGLTRLGLITDPNATVDVSFGDKTYKAPQFKIWYMHGLGHWLGMNVHDVGDYSAPLKAGMIFTNEPGIYLREDALDYLPDTPANREFLAKVRPVFERYKSIGVRIEDDLLVTESGVEWMTKNLPRKLDEIEAFMAAASNSVKIGALEHNSAPRIELLATENYQNDLFADGIFPASGKTVRYGWVYAGKNTTYSALNHTDH